MFNIVIFRSFRFVTSHEFAKNLEEGQEPVDTEWIPDQATARLCGTAEPKRGEVEEGRKGVQGGAAEHKSGRHYAAGSFGPLGQGTG